MRWQLTGTLCFALAFAGGCQSWHDTPLAPDATRELPSNTRLVTRNGEKVQLMSGHVTHDSVIGEQSAGQRIALPRDSVTAIEVSSLNWPRTLGLVYGGLFLVGIMIGEKF